jgi:hypothetical protein
VLVPVNRELTFTEELYSEKTRVMVKSFPEIDFGALIPVARKDGRKATGTEFLDAYGLSVRTPATATRTSLKIPSYGYELPVQVYEPSAISEIRINAPEMICKNCGRMARIDLLVGGAVPCLAALIPVEVTIGPTAVCSLKNEVSKRKTDSGALVYEMPFPQNLILVESAAGTCAITVEARGIGKSARAQIEVKK